MKNLQSFGVQELSAREIKETDGGNPIFEWMIDEVISFFESGEFNQMCEDMAQYGGTTTQYGVAVGF